MKTRLALTIQYDGTDFSGWQRQPGARTVQGEIEETLQRLCGGRLSLTGSGRTDAGVHALGQVAHLDVLPDRLDRVKKGLYSMVPEDIAITDVRKVNEDFHARFDAVSRLYRYRIEKCRNPLTIRYCHVLPPGHGLDTAAMKQAAEYSLGEHSWRGMAKEGSSNRTWLVDVTEAEVVEDHAGWTFLIRANRFLRGMVRLWTGTLVRIGSGAAGPELIPQLLSTEDRSRAGVSLPGRGLVLMEVKYR